jgi:hypothetical protein
MTSQTNTRWFYVAADYKSVHIGKSRKRHLWERRVFVFRARPEEAADRAARIAKQNEHEYISATGDRVRWELQAIESSAELFDDEITDGTEVYWDWFVRVDKDQPATRQQEQHAVRPTSQRKRVKE